MQTIEQIPPETTETASTQAEPITLEKLEESALPQPLKEITLTETKKGSVWRRVIWTLVIFGVLFVGFVALAVPFAGC